MKAKYGWDNSDNWCENNWGCDMDFSFQSLLYTKTEFLVTYQTRWYPNEEFIRFLGNKFPDIRFELDYVCPEASYAGYYKIFNGNEESDNLSFLTLFFDKVGETEIIGSPIFKFDALDTVNCENIHSEYIDIIGEDWKTAFINSKLNMNNVVNWDDVIHFINSRY